MSNIPDSNPLSQADASITIGSGIEVEIVTDPGICSPVHAERLSAAVVAAANDQGFCRGEIGIRITDDDTIHRINVDYLGHDYPTDVISFDYGSDSERIEGEMVVSADTAARSASELGWPVENELLLYVIHGTLHIAGMDDRHGTDREQMRAAERRVMLALGVKAVGRWSPSLDETNELGAIGSVSDASERSVMLHGDSEEPS